MNFVKAMNREWQVFKYLREKVPRLSDAKIKVHKICQLAKNTAYELILEGREEEAWEALKGIIHGFLGNKRDDNNTQLMTALLQKYDQLKRNISLKIYFLHSHLNLFST